MAFSREAYFIRQFKAKIGITPNKYRKQIVEKRKKLLANSSVLFSEILNVNIVLMVKKR